MNKIKVLGFSLLIAGIGVSAVAGSPSWHTTPIFHANTPAGYEVVVIKPIGAVVSFLGLIECPELEGAQQVATGTSARILNAEGERLAQFPRNFSFRITASLRKTVLAEPTGSFKTTEKPQDVLLKLKFRLKAYHGLDVREIPAESIRMIGVPADISSNERVYRVSFNVADLPITDRCVLEVLSPEGERVARFHFDLL